MSLEPSKTLCTGNLSTLNILNRGLWLKIKNKYFVTVLMKSIVPHNSLKSHVLGVLPWLETAEGVELGVT